MGKLVFDLDNTLYSFEATGFSIAMRAAIHKWFEVELKMTPEDAAALSNKYYKDYGLSGRGIKLHHQDKDLDQYLEAVHTLDMSKLAPCPELRTMLERANVAGWELWVMTNGTRKHADDCLQAMGIADIFGERVYDCRDQWANSAPGEVHNKPEQSAYEAFAKHAKQQPGESMVMIEDSMVNLHAPARLGWIPVWISYGHELPADAEPTSRVIKTVLELPLALEGVPV
jgi:pyrimidine 5'-nucleotidase